MRKLDKSEKLYRFARLLDKAVNMVVIILFLLLLLYSGYSLWYANSLRNDSFLSDDLAKYKPGSGEDSLEDLMKMNPDVTSWIVIDGTDIDYPVVQGDEDEEYLNKSVFGEFSLAGSLFLNTMNKRDFSDRYNLVYGHNVEGGAMLADVLEFRDASFFKNHKLGTLWYPDEDGKARADRIEIFAVVDTGGNDETIYQDPGAVKGEKLQKLLKHVMKKAVNKRPLGSAASRRENAAGNSPTDQENAAGNSFAGMDKNSRIIALSTCEDAVSFDRVLLFGELVPMTDREIREAKEASSGSETTKKARHWGILGIFTGVPPWALFSTGTMLLILLVYVIISMIKKGRHSR